MASEPNASQAWSRQLRTGLLDLAILRHLATGQVHGYALIAQLKEQGLMAADGGEATVYQAMQRLSKAGLATWAWSTPTSDGRPRKMYSITKPGRMALAHMTKEWRTTRGALDRLLEDPA